MTVATSFTNTLPSIVDSTAPAGAAPGSSGATRASDPQHAKSARGFASAFESALTDREASTSGTSHTRPAQTKPAFAAPARMAPDRPTASAKARPSHSDGAGAETRSGSSTATSKTGTAKSSGRSDFAAKDSAASKPSNADKASSAAKAEAADRPNPTKPGSERAVAKSDGPKGDSSQSDSVQSDTVQSSPGKSGIGKAVTNVKSAAGTGATEVDATTGAEAGSTVDAQNDTTDPAVTELAAGEGLLVVAVNTAPTAEVPAPDLTWGDLEGTQLASDQPQQLSGTEDTLQDGPTAVVAQPTPAASFPALVAAQTANAPATAESAAADHLTPLSAAEEEDENQEHSAIGSTRPETAAEAAAAAAPHANAPATEVAAAGAPAVAVAVPVVAAPSTSSDSSSDKAAARESASRAGSRRPEGKELPQAVELAPIVSKDPIAFTMQLKAAGVDTEEAVSRPATQASASPQAAPGALASTEPGQPTSAASGNTAPDPQPGSEPVKAAVAPVIASTAGGERGSRQDGRSGQDAPPSHEQAAAGGFSTPATEKPTAAPAASLSTPHRVETAANAAAANASRVVTAAEAVAEASSARVDQVQNLPRPVGPQRLALRVDPPPVAGTANVQAPGRAVDLYLEQRGADVHFAVRSADPSMVSDLQGSVKELSNRLEQAGFHTESFLPSDAVRSLGQAAASNGSAFRDDEPGQRQPSENPQGQSGQQSGQRESRQDREGQQPRWRSEFEEMFGRTAAGATAAPPSPRP
ncbi:MAG: hypothetical protein NTZ56_09755 [Acidobacteria bacterium]|nr:hypothetical protein [Acidobacteriota bacterium]